MSKELKAAILQQLNRGKGNAITGKLLAERLGFSDTRTLRHTIIDLIVEDSQAILFSDNGYFLADTPEECIESLAKLRSYGLNLFKHYKYLKRAARRKFSGQIPMKFS